MPKQVLTDEDRIFIAENGSDMTANEMGEILNKPTMTIRAYCYAIGLDIKKELGLAKPKKHSRDPFMFHVEEYKCWITGEPNYQFKL